MATSVLQVVSVPGFGAEDVVVDERGDVYTGTEDGSVFRVKDRGGRVERVGDTGGRPLGLELLPDGRILVCDAHRGLLCMDPADGSCEVLASHVAGRPMRFCNNAAVAGNGDIYFSDSSRHYSVEQWRGDFLENTCTGRLLRRNGDGSLDVLLEGLAFANGVALSADESAVLVAETGARTVVRRRLSGPEAGQVDRFAADLPGYPDNISRGSDGLIWVAVASPRDAVVERLRRAPLQLRRLAWRVPTALQPRPRRTARVMAFDDRGSVVHDRSLDASEYHMVTGVREHAGTVWLGSLIQPGLAWFTL